MEHLFSYRALHSFSFHRGSQLSHLFIDGLISEFFSYRTLNGSFFRGVFHGSHFIERLIYVLYSQRVLHKFSIRRVSYMGPIFIEGLTQVLYLFVYPWRVPACYIVYLFVEGIIQSLYSQKIFLGSSFFGCSPFCRGFFVGPLFIEYIIQVDHLYCFKQVFHSQEA